MGSRAKLTVSYLGGGFHGWQRQPGRRTVQGELERVLCGITGEPGITVVGAGRTDSGVHAAGQVAHVDLPGRIPADGLHRALNQGLSDDVRVRSVRRVHATFHSRRDAAAKHYCFRARWRTSSLPWIGLRCATVAGIADPGALDLALGHLAGTNDMASFSVPEVATRSTVRTLHRTWFDERSDGLDLHFVGDGFLRYQVRRMVGAALAVGRGELTVDALERLVRVPTPGAPIRTAPARGLTLEKVYYRAVPALGISPGSGSETVPKTSRNRT
jgi:tRNA pseudouridine38-40 synthase